MLHWVSGIVLAVGLGFAAAAQDLPDAVTEAYVAYTEALEAGDHAAAAEAARTAWRAAESSGVDLETTAILADNYAQLASALGQLEQAEDAYVAAAEHLSEAGSPGEVVADTWVLAANAALNARDHRLAVRHADTAGDLAEGLTGIDPDRRAGLLFLSRSIHANALWLDGRPVGAGVRAAEAMAAAEGRDLTGNSRYGLTAFILGAAHAIEQEFDEAAFRLTEALRYMDTERRGLSIWVEYVRSRLDADERLDLLARLESAGLITEGEGSGDDADSEAERPEGWVYATPARRSPPDYPTDAARAGAEGVALVRFTVDERGRTTDIEVVISVPYSDFGTASTEAIERWRYNPATVDGQPVRQEGLITQFEYVLAN